ncbi:MAG: hypothetical protein ACTSVC_05465 [Promethearchaeota archaeon]
MKIKTKNKIIFSLVISIFITSITGIRPADACGCGGYTVINSGNILYYADSGSGVEDDPYILHLSGRYILYHLHQYIIINRSAFIAEEDDISIKIKNSDHITIKNTTIMGELYISHSTIYIENTTISGGVTGIYGYNSHLIVVNNTFQNIYRAINLENSIMTFYFNKFYYYSYSLIQYSSLVYIGGGSDGNYGNYYYDYLLRHPDAKPVIPLNHSNMWVYNTEMPYDPAPIFTFINKSTSSNNTLTTISYEVITATPPTLNISSTHIFSGTITINNEITYNITDMGLNQTYLTSLFDSMNDGVLFLKITSENILFNLTIIKDTSSPSIMLVNNTIVISDLHLEKLIMKDNEGNNYFGNTTTVQENNMVIDVNNITVPFYAIAVDKAGNINSIYIEPEKYNVDNMYYYLWTTILISIAFGAVGIILARIEKKDNKRK